LRYFVLSYVTSATTTNAMTEMPANTPSPIGSTCSFLPGRTNAAADALAVEFSAAAVPDWADEVVVVPEFSEASDGRGASVVVVVLDVDDRLRLLELLVEVDVGSDVDVVAPMDSVTDVVPITESAGLPLDATEALGTAGRPDDEKAIDRDPDASDVAGIAALAAEDGVGIDVSVDNVTLGIDGVGVLIDGDG